MQSPLTDLMGNRVLWAAVAGWLAAQGIKVLLALALTRKFEPSYLFASGGMPSSHSALVMGLATGVALVTAAVERLRDIIGEVLGPGRSERCVDDERAGSVTQGIA